MESTLNLINRNKLSLTGITKVKSTEPSAVIAILADGSIIISGANLSVENLNIKEGVLELSGTVNSIKYSNQVSKSFSFKNMFK